MLAMLEMKIQEIGLILRRGDGAAQQNGSSIRLVPKMDD